MTQPFDLRRSQALWNREGLDLASDEMLAQILDRGELAAWRDVYRHAAAPTAQGAALRRRIVHLCCTVPLAFPHLFLAAMAHLGEVVDPYPDVPTGDDAA
jgi:predicted LPLAT superfamily acyltransferase